MHSSTVYCSTRFEGEVATRENFEPCRRLASTKFVIIIDVEHGTVQYNILDIHIVYAMKLTTHGI